jgi:putative membrane protein
MSALNRRRATFIGVSGLSLAIAGAVAPGAYAADTIDGDVKVSNTETVQVLMNASGKVDAQRIYEQVVLRGNGKVDLANPVSTKGLRNLDGFGGFDVRDGSARIKTDVNGTKKYRSVSDYTKDLPLKFEATYLLDGKEIEPSDVVGRSGRLEVKYRVTNQTGREQEITYLDGKGKKQTTTETVVVPMVGSLTTTLPSTFTNVETNGSNSAGDGRGGTQLSFTMTLFPPIGDAVAEIGYTADVKDAVIPKASLSALPVNALENKSFKGGAASYQGGAQSGQDLTAGATQIDANLLKIRDGAADLVDGLLQLQAGANKLSDGLQNEAAPGAGKLADGAKALDAGASKLGAGTGQLSAGADKLSKGAGDLADGTGKLKAGANKLDKGAGDLSDGLAEASAGGPALIKGVADLKAGAEKVDAGLVKLQGSVSAGVGAPSSAGTLRNGVAQLIGGVGSQGPIQGGLRSIDNALVQAEGLLASLPDSPQKAGIAQYLGGARSGLTSVTAGLNGTVTGGLQQLDGGLQQLNGQVAAGVGTPGSTLPDGSPSLRNGTGQLIGGLGQLETQGGKLAAGLEQLSAGADQLEAGTGDLSNGASDLDAGAGKLAAGTGDLKAGATELNAGAGTLKAGTGKLSAGAGTLAGGLGTAAAGSGELAAGLDKAAEAAPALPEGASKLSKEGTKKLVSTGNKTAMDYGLKYALIEESSKRGASAQPYGSPEGAMALTAYKYEIAGEDGAASANMKRGLAALALLAGAGAFAAVRRRGLI